MPKKSQTLAKRHRTLLSVGQALQSQTVKQFRSRGFWDMDLLCAWKDHLGADLSQKIEPISIRRNGKGGSTLTVQTPSAYATEIAMRHEEICMRLNTALGYEAITKIHIRHVSGEEDLRKHCFRPDQSRRSTARQPDQQNQNSNQKTKKSQFSINLKRNKDLEAALNELAEEFFCKHKQGH